MRAVLGFVQECNNCGVTALLSEPDGLWTCSDCTGEEPETGDPWSRVHELLRALCDSLQAVRYPELEGALLDTVDALDDDDPDAWPVGQVTG